MGLPADPAVKRGNVQLEDCPPFTVTVTQSRLEAFLDLDLTAEAFTPLKAFGDSKTAELAEVWPGAQGVVVMP